jgi:hypothetical protein
MATLREITCETCGVGFQPSRKDHVFCSVNCRVTAYQRRKRKALADIKLNAGCCVCGYNKCHAALQFDHINPLEKSFNIGENTGSKPLDVLIAETEKCRVICANCHAEHTFENKHHFITRVGTT